MKRREDWQGFKAGQRVRITGKHSWAKHSGTYCGVEFVSTLNEYAALVRLDNGQQTYVFETKDMAAA